MWRGGLLMAAAALFAAALVLPACRRCSHEPGDQLNHCDPRTRFEELKRSGAMASWER